MIAFTCTCKNPLSVPDDEAGGFVQCTKCGRLNDVPALDDLARLDDDGTYRLDASPAPQPPARVGVGLAFRRGTTGEDGEEIDLRLREEDLTEVGSPERPVLAYDRVSVEKPKYDPETGELIQALDVRVPERGQEQAAEAPVAARAISYATAQGLEKRVPPGRVPVELLMPANLVVMGCILLVHLVSSGIVFMLQAAVLLVFPFVVVMELLIAAHYGNTVEDIGPDAQDELPRPLRDMGFYEDIWKPMTSMVGGLMLCYGPGLYVARSPLAAALGPAAATAAVLALAAVGTWLCPAVLLTLNTSGAGANLRPDRLLGVIRASGRGYWVAAGAAALSGVAYALAAAGLHGDFVSGLLRTGPLPDWMSNPAVGLGALAAAVYATHGLCWLLGLLYRAHHDAFPWVLQRHVRKPKEGRPRPAADAAPRPRRPLHAPAARPPRQADDIPMATAVAPPPGNAAREKRGGPTARHAG